MNLKVANFYYTVPDLLDGFGSCVDLDYHDIPTTGAERRLIEATQIKYLADDTSTILSDGTMESKGLVYKQYRQAFTHDHFYDIYQQSSTNIYTLSDLSGNGKYEDINSDGNWWVASEIIHYTESGHAVFTNPSETFYLPKRFEDPFGNFITLEYYSTYLLMISQVTDQLNNITEIEEFDMRLLQPELLRDEN